MKKQFILFALALTTSWTAIAQAFNFQFDHYSIIVADVDKSADFYRDILGLKETPHPDKSPGFRWFIINENSQIHLIQKEVAYFELNKTLHLCLATQDLEGVMAHLKKNGIPFSDWPGNENSISHRSDGVDQIYIQDPDNYWIEINTAKH
jgi:catechol 2,3-dioxygenase-like lactoylglutathione lyase family enzyme